MHAFLHLVGAIVIVPYVALAMFFIFVGAAASSKGLMALFDTVLYHANWFYGWGIYIIPALWICLVATGFLPSLQRASSLCLCLLAVSCFLVVVSLHSTRIGLGELVFLIPCVAVAATSAWLFFHTGAKE
jgi:hypothetical protein